MTAPLAFIYRHLLIYESMKTTFKIKRTKAQLELARSTRRDIAKLKVIAARISKIVTQMKDERKTARV